jgi:hypothetical protein
VPPGALCHYAKRPLAQGQIRKSINKESKVNTNEPNKSQFMQMAWLMGRNNGIMSARN